MAVATRMTVDELCLATAIQCKRFGHETRAIRSQLDVTPRAHFDESLAWTNSNPKVCALISSDPQAVAAGSYSLNAARGWFARLIGLGKSRGTSAPDDTELSALEGSATPKAPVDPDKARRMAELRELVDDSFDAV